MTPIVFTVEGLPQPQGSARAFMRPGARFPVVTSDNPKVKGWRKDVAKAARAVYRGAPIDGPIRIVAAFHLYRPKSLRISKAHVTRPDVDKLARAIGDALTGVLFADDGQVTEFKVTKAYAAVGAAPRAVIVVTPLTEEGRLL